MLSQPNGRGDPGRPSGQPPEVRPQTNGEAEPGWAGGLRKLYNSVVQEPLPDSFKDLLQKLDDDEDG
ncbi:NepR family anti-sigma factor [Novosphingobium sp. Leaf2]|uniref:NepR family anti-sigma factor n=1 Tax=Novosphingobium sp. Leaf2 TaxID=1735670 RepID=UPI001F4041A1|nr:NepR family anti-sigma factor [Novosphingobium sp. Leaf2]